MAAGHQIGRRVKAEHGGRDRRAERGVEDHAGRRPARNRSHGERGVISEHRSDSDQHGVAGRPQRVPDLGLRFRIGCILRRGPGQDAAVERLGVPEDDERAIAAGNGAAEQAADVYCSRQTFSGKLMTDEGRVTEPVLFGTQVTLVTQVRNRRCRDDLADRDPGGPQAVDLARVVGREPD